MSCIGGEVRDKYLATNELIGVKLPPQEGSELMKYGSNKGLMLKTTGS